jgi:hypothetical protein
LFDEHAGGRGGEVNRHVAGGNFDQAIAFDHALSAFGVPGRDDHGHTREVKIRQSKIDRHGIGS